MGKAEKLVFDNISLQKFLSKKLLKQLKTLNPNLFPVSIVLMEDKEIKKGERIVYPVVLNHQNKQEVDKGVLHIESPNTDLLESMSKFIERFKK